MLDEDVMSVSRAVLSSHTLLFRHVSIILMDIQKKDCPISFRKHQEGQSTVLFIKITILFACAIISLTKI